MEITVGKLIELLQAMSKDLIVCQSDGFDGHSSIQKVWLVENKVYIDDRGDEAIGDVVTIY